MQTTSPVWYDVLPLYWIYKFLLNFIDNAARERCSPNYSCLLVFSLQLEFSTRPNSVFNKQTNELLSSFCRFDH